MSGTIAAAATQTSTTASGSSTSTNPASALSSLTDNYQTFLKMLTTQLQNQDPTSPMDSSQFTTELVQFSGVEQQINTNSNLNQLITLAQGSSVMQSSQILGKQVEATSKQLSLQQGTAQVNFTAPSAEPVTVSVSDANGNVIATSTVNATQGANSWTWNGQNSSGSQMPDGAYTVNVAAASSTGATSALPFTVVGKATSVEENGSTVTLQLGALSVNMSAVTSVQN